MRILNARVRWMEGYNNDPELEVLADHLPDYKDLRYEENNGCYFAERDGYVSFFYHSGNPEQQEGYFGRHFHITMKDGTEKTLKGPWSSRSGVMNKMGFEPSREVAIFTDQASYDRGYIAYAGHITERLFKLAVKTFCPGVVVEPREKYGETTLFLHRVDNPCEVCKGAGHYIRLGRDEQCRRCDGTGHEPVKQEVA